MAIPTFTVFSALSRFSDSRRTIIYIENNPLPLHLPRQTWPFVTPYDNWPLHAGHSPNSPYVKLLKLAGRYPL